MYVLDHDELSQLSSMPVHNQMFSYTTLAENCFVYTNLSNRPPVITFSTKLLKLEIFHSINLFELITPFNSVFF